VFGKLDESKSAVETSPLGFVTDVIFSQPLISTRGRKKYFCSSSQFFFLAIALAGLKLFNVWIFLHDAHAFEDLIVNIVYE
jgi:hypothetical protein